jgi:Asparagine synthase
VSPSGFDELDPYVLVIDAVLTRGNVSGWCSERRFQGARQRESGRRNREAFVEDAAFANRVAETLGRRGLALELDDLIDVCRYQEGEGITAHVDASRAVSGRRRSDATLLICLSDEFSGGETVFPRYGLTITPLAGRAVLDLFRTAVWSFDEPVVRASMLAQFKLYRVFKAQGIKVVLSSQGGDEMFCGYPFTWPSLLSDTLRQDGLCSTIRMARASSATVRGLWTELVPAGLIERVALHAMREPTVLEDVLAHFDPDLTRARARWLLR